MEIYKELETVKGLKISCPVIHHVYGCSHIINNPNCQHETQRVLQCICVKRLTELSDAVIFSTPENTQRILYRLMEVRIFRI